MESLTIRQIIEHIVRGQIRIPAFQRGFVWDSEMVAYLMDSIYKGFPIGALLLWRTRETLKFERQLGPFRLPEVDPDFPIDYVLDGQQRITSIFGVFQTDLTSVDDADWSNVYFDYRADPNMQESQFVAIEPEKADLNRHFLLRNFFDTAGYRRATSSLDEATAGQMDQVQAVFKEARIPVEQLQTEDRKTVAIVFARINTRKVDLNTIQLLTAWTWSEEFDLQNRFTELSDELQPFGFQDVGLDQNLLLRCFAAVLTQSASETALVNFDGATIRSRFDEIRNGILGAIDFLKTNVSVHALHNLPNPSLLIPLTVFFAVAGASQLKTTDEQRRTILRWFWRTCFTNRYKSQPTKTVEGDIEQVIRLKRRDPSKLGEFPVQIGEDFFTENSFRIDSVATRTIILMLANHRPKSFVSGNFVTLSAVLKEYNRNEFHHLFPKSF